MVKTISAAALCLLLCSFTAAAQTLHNGTFDASVSEWTLPAGSAAYDASAGHGGKGSVRLTHQTPAHSTVRSVPVTLTIGSLYRVSAWVKTEGVRTAGHEQYPTPLGACLSMASFPFTNQSTTAGGTSDWKKIEAVFIATQATDAVCLHLGKNGDAQGTAWFDDVTIEPVSDITQLIPMETVKWYGDAFRFEDRGWIFVHIEGAPYKRGYQYGYLVADEIREFVNKLSINKNNAAPQAGWNEMRFAADALMLRKFDAEFLEEMKGIADGANKAGATIFGRPLSLIDIVTLNCAVDISYAGDALPVTPTALTGKSFLSAEDELTVQERLHKCSSFLATKSATKDKRIVFGQLFMWNGYTGIHWNVIVDDQPAAGHRLVYETFPGGIHSGADWYINDAGIMIGETTVNQGPFDADGTPQSYRIRKAAQYSNSIDDVVRIMTEKNNGLYTNDWLIGDAKTDEVAVLALGTKTHTLWRSSKGQWYDGQKDWYWSDNNVKSDNVRREYAVNEDNAPYDAVFRPVNRDISFRKFYDTTYSAIDANAGIDVLATSPINRPHACDGKVTTGAMADRMMFFAHYGKVTLREKFVSENGRIPDLPGAQPQFTLGYSVIAPKLFVDGLKKAHAAMAADAPKHAAPENFDSVKNVYAFDKQMLWHGSVFPASAKENWYTSGTAAYWNMLNAMPAGAPKASAYLRDELNELNCRIAYTTAREGAIAANEAKVSYEQFKYYQVPRIRGTFALHQLRLLLGNAAFSKAMTALHNAFAGREASTQQIVALLEKETGRPLKAFIGQWLERCDLPAFTVSAEVSADKASGPLAEASAAAPASAGAAHSAQYTVNAVITQKGTPYHFLVTAALQTEKETIHRLIEVDGASTSVSISVVDKPLSLTVNSGADVPTERENYFTFSNFSDDFSTTAIVYGTSRQTEANHTLALKFQKMAADRFTESLLPLYKDTEISDAELASRDLVVLGSPADNELAKRIAEKLSLQSGGNWFAWKGTVYGASDDGLFIAAPNPFNPSKAVYWFIGNSILQQYAMTKTLPRIPSWAVFKKDAIVEKGYRPAPAAELPH